MSGDLEVVNKTLNEMGKDRSHQPTKEMRVYADSLSTEEERAFAHSWISNQ